MIDAALVSYVGVMSVTPGPNNLLLAASGVHFGLRRTLPQMLGVSMGLFLQIFLVTVTLQTAVSWVTGIRPWLAVVGCGYLLVLSWQIFWAGAPQEKEGRRPMRFHESILFQAVNPKAWVMVVNVALLFAPRQLSLVEGSALLALLCAAVNLPCVGLWAVTGDRLRRFLARGRAALVFNGAMGLLMAGTAVWLLIREFLPH
jgi:threonine/homoserine/homoserine lactone efflux protein